MRTVLKTRYLSDFIELYLVMDARQWRKCRRWVELKNKYWITLIQINSLYRSPYNIQLWRVSWEGAQIWMINSNSNMHSQFRSNRPHFFSNKLLVKNDDFIRFIRSHSNLSAFSRNSTIIYIIQHSIWIVNSNLYFCSDILYLTL